MFFFIYISCDIIIPDTRIGRQTARWIVNDVLVLSYPLGTDPQNNIINIHIFSVKYIVIYEVSSNRFHITCLHKFRNVYVHNT